MSKKLFYGLLVLVFGLGITWIALSSLGLLNGAAAKCTFKQLTGIPCASCGTTRSVKLVFAGDFGAAIAMNPLGIMVAFVIVLVPVWLIYDVLSGRQTLFTNYKRAETIWPVRRIALIMGVLLMLNWIWNVYKGN